MKKPIKPGILAQAFENAAKDFKRDKDDFGPVSANSVGALGVALSLAALLYTVMAGKSLLDVLTAGVLGAMALSAVVLMKYLNKPGEDND